MTATILVIDDTPAIVDALQCLLTEEGYLVETLGDHDHILQAIQEKQPDLVLLDVWMSGEDGRELCREIKQHEILKTTPVLLMSAHRNLPQMSELAGADGCISKPFMIDELLLTIEKALKQHTHAHR